MRPTSLLRVHQDWRNPWERREAFRYQAPFVGGRAFTYNRVFKPALASFMVYWFLDELINHGPLGKYVYGAPKDNHGHGEDHRSMETKLAEGVEQLAASKH